MEDESGITSGLIRMTIGIENVQDIIAIFIMPYYKMKILFSAAFATIFICCANNKKDSERGSINTAITNYDSSLHPLLEIGAYYTYEINIDTMMGLLVATINKEEDSVYYSFMVSGKYFKVAPSEKEFQLAGLHGSYSALLRSKLSNIICKIFRFGNTSKTCYRKIQKDRKDQFIKRELLRNHCAF